MLRHIKDIRSPIFVAQQKQAQRIMTPAPGSSSGRPAVSPSTATTPDAKSEYSRNTRLHQPPVLHPISAQAQAVAAAAHMQEEEPLPAPHPDINASIANAANSPGGNASGSGSRSPMASYAIAIYPYTAEQEDEFDVAV